MATDSSAVLDALEVLIGDLVDAVAELRSDPSSDKARNALRVVRRELDRLQAQSDLVGLAKACTSDDDVSRYVQSRLEPLADERPMDERIPKAISALLALDPSRNSPGSLDSYLRLLEPFDDFPNAYQLDRIAAARICWASDSALSGEQAQLNGAVEAAEAAIELARRNDDVQDPPTSQQRHTFVPLVRQAQERGDAQLARLLILRYGHVLVLGDLNSLLQVILRDLAGAREAASLLRSHLSQRQLNGQLGSSLLRVFRQRIQAGQVSEDDDLGLGELLDALVTHPSENPRNGCLELPMLRQLLVTMLVKCPALVPDLVARLMRSGRSAIDRGFEVDESIIAIALTALARSQSPDIDLLSELMVALRSRSSSPAPLIEDWLQLPSDVPLHAAARLLRILVLRPESLEEPIRPVPAVQLSERQRAMLRSRLLLLANQCETNNDFSDLSTILDVLSAAECVSAPVAMEVLGRFPRNSSEFEAGRELADARRRVATLTSISLARAESARVQGNFREALLRLAAAPVTRDSVPLRLQVLSGTNSRGDDYVRDLMALASLRNAKDALDLSGLTDRTTSDENLAIQELLDQASDRVGRSRNRREELNALTSNLGFHVVGADNWDAFTNMPTWLVSAWAASMDTQRRRDNAIEMLEACYAAALGRLRGALAQGKATENQVERVVHLGALRCERYARRGRGFKPISQVIEEMGSMALYVAPESTAARHILSIYEQLLVATKKPDRARTFTEQVQPQLRSRGLDPSAGIWTTVILGGISSGIPEGLMQWEAAITSLEEHRSFVDPDGFFSPRESAAIATSLCRSLDLRNLESRLEGLQTSQLSPSSTHAMAIRIVTDALTVVGDIEGLMRLKRICEVTAEYTGDKEIHGLVFYVGESKVPGLVARLGREPEADVARAIFVETCEAISGVSRDASDRELDALARLVVSLLASLSESDQERASAEDLLSRIGRIGLEPRQATRLFTRLLALALSELGPQSEAVQRLKNSAGARNVDVPPRLLAAMEASAVEDARDAVGLSTEKTDLREPMMTVSQFHAFVRLLKHELAPIGMLLYDLTEDLEMQLRHGMDPVQLSRSDLQQLQSATSHVRGQYEILARQLKAAASESRIDQPATQTVEDVCKEYGGRVIFEEPGAQVAGLKTSMPSDSLALVLHTLLRNAHEASGSPARVSCRWTAPAPMDIGNEQGWLVIAIANDGQSVPQEVVERISEGLWSDKTEFGGIGANLANINLRLWGGWLQISELQGSQGALVTLGLLPDWGDSRGRVKPI